jgi:hypothetical protein
MAPAGCNVVGLLALIVVASHAVTMTAAQPGTSTYVFQVAQTGPANRALMPYTRGVGNQQMTVVLGGNKTYSQVSSADLRQSMEVRTASLDSRLRVFISGFSLVGQDNSMCHSVAS